MTKADIRRIAVSLRKEGESYSQIKKKIKISKSTLSRWLKDYPLSKERIRALRDNNQQRIEKFRQTMLKKREKLLASYYKEQRKKILPLSKKELLLAGLFLYWGEGNKAVRHIISLNNTDPQVIKFTLVWLRKIINIPKERIRVYLHLYSDMDVKKEIQFWAKTLNMPVGYFDKPYIKKSKRIDLDQKGYGHGTCGLRVSNTVLKDNIIMAIKVIADFYGEKVEEV
ncbi:MAG: helix-turn-helix domain-containing protein [Candidatus Roizmanbacteria bacterium]|nr:MAG: helix-turn-helix domain-containing protein [Candidatus Roizmanbacteria bacterium]